MTTELECAIQKLWSESTDLGMPTGLPVTKAFYEKMKQAVAHDAKWNKSLFTPRGLNILLPTLKSKV